MSDHPKARVTSESDAGRINTELSSRRTGMSFQRTRMSADRTLMSVIRTSLSLISFGFTIFQVFEKAARGAACSSSSNAARNFGIALVLLGIAMLIGGIVYHVQFMYGLRKERAQLKADGLVHGREQLSGVADADDGADAAADRLRCDRRAWCFGSGRSGEENQDR